VEVVDHHFDVGDLFSVSGVPENEAACISLCDCPPLQDLVDVGGREIKTVGDEPDGPEDFYDQAGAAKAG
jgi:hypothetical protein